MTLAGEKPARGRVARSAAFQRGLSAEKRAEELFVSQGFAIVARRWRSGVGEIDLVARGGNLIVFVEVKARRRLDEAAFSVTARQRARIVAAAEAWLAENPHDAACDMRFDAVLVAARGPVHHIPAAFDADM